MRRRTKYDIYIIIFLAIAAICYFLYNNISSEERGVNAYSTALELYRTSNYELAYQAFAKVPSGSALKDAARFRQARCATNIQRKDLAIKKYEQILNSHTKSTIVPISEYNLATLMLDQKDKRAKKHFENIIKKYPTSDYAIAAQYYLGVIEVSNLPRNGKKNLKGKNQALIYFKNYIEKAPDGRFAINAVNEILKLDVKLTNYDNLLISKVYYANGEFEKSQSFLNKTTLSESWTDFAKTTYKLGNKDKTKYYTEHGLKDYAAAAKPEDVYEVIDNYLSIYPTRKDGIKSLVDKSYNSTGADYIAYLNCSEAVDDNLKESCYSNMYEKNPNGQFSGDALYNVFMIKYLQKKYYDAQRLGFLHFEKFPNVKSSPAVVYYMGKISKKLKHYENANMYYKKVITEYPDSYYAYRAHININKEDGVLPFVNINPKPVVFPYKKSLNNNLVLKLALLKDYDLVEELCKKDKFIQSWISYQKGNYTISAILARNAMEELTTKPAFDDLRWRLVYPLHYFKTVEQYQGNNNPIILESIIKEESHFNKFAGSAVGATYAFNI
jgi:TolA-binding protein